MQGLQVWSLVGELRLNMPHGQKPKLNPPEPRNSIKTLKMVHMKFKKKNIHNPLRYALLRVSARPLPWGTAHGQPPRDTSLLGPAMVSDWRTRRSKGSGPVPDSGQQWGPSQLQNSSRIGCSLSYKLQINFLLCPILPSSLPSHYCLLRKTKVGTSPHPVPSVPYPHLHSLLHNLHCSV